MNKNFCFTGILLFSFVLFGAGCISTVYAQSPDDFQSLITDLQAQIKALQTRIEELRLSDGMPLLPSAGGFTRDLFRGLEGDDVRALQKFLAKDSEIYPEGLVTSYFGPLTEKAVQRWQASKGIVSSGIAETTGYGRVGPKTRAKLNALLVEKPAVSESQPELPPQESQKELPPAMVLPEPEVATSSLDSATSTTSTQVVSLPKPTPNIKSGAGSAITNSVFDFGTGAIHYKELGRLGESGAFYLRSAAGGQTNPSLFLVHASSPKGSSCDPHDATALADAIGPKSICEFTDAANFAFSNKEELVRFHEKSSSCYDGIVLFRQNNLYGGIEPEDVTKNGDLTYHYWYDASGGSDFSDACLLGKGGGSPALLAQAGLASVLDSLGDVLDKIKREIKTLSR